MRQSGIGVPSGEIFWPTRCTRPSTFVTLPSFSPHIAAGRNTSARFVLSVTNASIAIVKPTASSAARASVWSGQSSDGSVPRSMSACTRPSFAAPRIPIASRPRCCGTLPHASSNQARPSSSETRPGRKPGREPEVQCAADVAPAQRGEESGPAQLGELPGDLLGHARATRPGHRGRARRPRCRRGPRPAPRRGPCLRPRPVPPLSAATRRRAASACSPGTERMDACA